MTKKIINLEINEISPALFDEYIKKRPKSKLARLRKNQQLNISKTKALDIKKEKLYPSITWASFNTGKSYSEHKCYWYSDNINKEDLIWNKLADNNISVGILGSLHSSKYSDDLIDNKNYKFYLPDCFSSDDFAKPLEYKYFQSFNNLLVAQSGRVTGLKNLLKSIFNYSFKILHRPRKFGISFFSLRILISIIFNCTIHFNKEFLRMAQFPLLASIFRDLFIKHQPQYSTLFSNHVAGNMHRYWYAHDPNSFRGENKYSQKWIERNKRSIFLGIDYVDNYLDFILNKKEFKNSIILITSSMGQEANPKFDGKKLAKYETKINNMDLFLRHFSYFQKKDLGESLEFINCRNMWPQYGLKVKNKTNLDLKVISESIKNYLISLGFTCKVDLENESIVFTLGTDLKFKNKYSIKQAKNKFSKYGFEFVPIDDHHSGSHCEDGSLIVINSNYKFTGIINRLMEEKGYINYLNFHKLITKYFLA